MADKPIIYTDQGIRSYDHMKGWSDGVKAIGRAVSAILGLTNTVSVGFVASPQGTPNMSINLTEGQVYSLGPVDSSNYGVLAADTTQIMQGGWAAAQTLQFSTSGLTAGQSQCFLVQVAFLQSDQVRPDDPTSGVLPFVNTSDLLQPLQGENGLLGTLPTCRYGTANVTILPGTPATSPATPIPPAPSAGAVGLCVVTLTFGQSSITAGNITVASSAANLAGLLNSHHGGISGQAPKINLTSEVQYQLPLANTTCSSATAGGTLSTFLGIFASSPVGTLAGTIKDTCFCSTNNTWYVCTATGTATSTPGPQAQWGTVGGSSAATFIENDTWPYNCTSGFIEVLGKVTAGNGVFNLPAASSLPNASISVAKKDSSPNSIVVTTTGTGDTISEGLNTGLSTFNVSVEGNWFTFRNLYDTATSEWIWYVK